MKTTAIKIFATLFVLSLFILTGCKKAEAGPTGPTGPTGPQGPVVNMSNGGFVTATLTGTRRDNTVFAEPFSYTYYFPGTSGAGTLDSLAANSYRYNFSRSTNDIFSNNSSNITIMASSKAATTGTLSLSVNFEKMLSGNKLFTFSAYTSTATVTSLAYNTTTGMVSGNFNVSYTAFQTNTSKTATVTGSFQTAISELVYKPQASNGKKD